MEIKINNIEALHKEQKTMNNNNREEEVNLADILHVVWNFRPVILLFVVIGGVEGFYFPAGERTAIS